MVQGIIKTIERAAALVFIAPVIFLALDAAYRGDWLVSVAFAAVAAIMFGLGEIVTRPSDLPAEAAERTAGAIFEDED